MDAERIAEIQTLLHQSRDVQGYWPETLRATVSSLLSEIDGQDLRIQHMDGLIHRGHVAMQAATEFQAVTEQRVEAQRQRADAAEALVATLTQRLNEALRTREAQFEALRMEHGWPTPNHMRSAAKALDALTFAKYGDVLRWVADRCDAVPEPEPEPRPDPFGLDRDDGQRSDRGYCYGVEDGLDGYCVHDPRCRSVGRGWTGPNSDCYVLVATGDGAYVREPDGHLRPL